MSGQQATPNDAYLIIMLAAQAKPFFVAATVLTRCRGLQVLGCRGLQLGRGASASATRRRPGRGRGDPDNLGVDATRCDFKRHVGGSSAPKNMSSSMGRMTFTIYGKIKHIPNHQPAHVRWCITLYDISGYSCDLKPSDRGHISPIIGHDLVWTI